MVGPAEPDGLFVDDEQPARVATTTRQAGLPGGIVGFGEDASGELYAVSINSNSVYQVQVLDLSDWDKSVMTNVPGESGDPRSPHYDDLIDDWREGKYHPMPYTRAAVEAATTERIRLQPR